MEIITTQGYNVTFADFVLLCNQQVTFYILFPAIALLGIYLSVRLRFLQLSKLIMGLRSVFRKEEKTTGSISRYEAVAAVLASNFGTGNISGMAVALSVGGPGACVWMWVVAFLASIVQYANCLLGVKYREQNSAGEFVGGPMYYLKKGLKSNRAALIFSLFVIIAAFSVGNFAQSNSIALPLKQLGIPPLVTGLFLACLIGGVLLGGVQRLLKLFSTLVPCMALLYFGTALLILVLHKDHVGDAFLLMFKSAFGLEGVVGGVAGAALMKAITTGFDRAIFATDAASGLVPMLQSGSRSTEPVVDGVVALVAPFLVMIVCTTTTLVLIVTGAFEQGLESTNMVTFAYSKGLSSQAGFYIVVTSLFLFGYTTALAWANCMQKAVTFLWGPKLLKPFVWLYILVVPIGALMKVSMVWVLADLALSCMVLLNLIAVFGLSKEVVADTLLFFDRDKAKIKRVI